MSSPRRSSRCAGSPSTRIKIIGAATAFAVAPLLAGLPSAGAESIGSTADSRKPGPSIERSHGKKVHDVTEPDRVTAADLDFPNRRLRNGNAHAAGFVPEALEAVPTHLRSFLKPSPTNPMYAGGVVLASRRGVVPVRDAAGHAVRYGDSGEELPAGEQVPMRTDMIFDLASVTKTFTTLAVMQQVEDGRIDLDRPVASYLPAFAANGKEAITVRQLLTHTGGLPAWKALYSIDGDAQDRFDAVLAVEPASAPGEKYVYSDFGMITLGLLVEEVSGQSLDVAISEGITTPLGMTDTMFNPPAALKDRIVATEAQPWVDRPMIRGEVHDENAWSLGGVAGHAGLFSTADDLAVLSRALLNGGRYGDTRIMSPETVRTMLRNENTEFPEDSHGLGFELDQRWYMDAMSSPVTFGHTGFTGTSVVIDPMSDSFVILLTNRVHPTRDGGSNNPSRRAMARAVGRAVPVQPLHGKDAWFSGIGDSRDPSLTLSAKRPERLDFGLWYDTEAGFDKLTVESSVDGGKTWAAQPFTIRGATGPWENDGTISGFGGRTWHRVSAQLPDAPRVQVRWRYVSDDAEQGRGVYLDDVRLDGRRVSSGALTADGFSLSRN